MTDNRIAPFQGCYTGVVHDVMRAMGCKNFTLPPRITPLQPEMTLVGPAWTVQGRVDETADPQKRFWRGPVCCPKPKKATSGQPNLTRTRSRKWANFLPKPCTAKVFWAVY